MSGIFAQGNCIINEAGGKLIDLNGNQRIYNAKKTLIEPGLIAGNNDAVDKVFNLIKFMSNKNYNIKHNIVNMTLI